jgi:hypothetical protein
VTGLAFVFKGVRAVTTIRSESGWHHCNCLGKKSLINERGDYAGRWKEFVRKGFAAVGKRGFDENADAL